MCTKIIEKKSNQFLVFQIVKLRQHIELLSATSSSAEPAGPKSVSYTVQLIAIKDACVENNEFFFRDKKKKLNKSMTLSDENV